VILFPGEASVRPLGLRVLALRCLRYLSRMPAETNKVRGATVTLLGGSADKRSAIYLPSKDFRNYATDRAFCFAGVAAARLQLVTRPQPESVAGYRQNDTELRLSGGCIKELPEWPGGTYAFNDGQLCPY